MHDHAKYAFGTADKIEIVRALILYGVKFIELFSPIVHSRERDDLVAIRETRDTLITQKGYTFLISHVRCNLGLRAIELCLLNRCLDRVRLRTKTPLEVLHKQW